MAEEPPISSLKKTAIVAPTKKPTAFVIPSIIVDPGTPHAKKSNFVNKESTDEDIIKSSNDIDSYNTDQTDSSIDKNPPLITVQKVPKFEIQEEETDEKNEIKNEIANEIHTGNGGLDVHTDKNMASRRFSKLPPAPKDSPNAVKLGSKFTKIEIPDNNEEVKINQAVVEELKDEFSESVEIMDEISADQNDDADGSSADVVGDTLQVHVEKSRRFRYLDFTYISKYDLNFQA